jgi:hypothetical protein
MTTPEGTTTDVNAEPTATDKGAEPDAPTQGNPNAKEARYRVERNEARQERDSLTQRVQTLLSREAERVASKHLSEPSDLFTLSGKSVNDFIGEDGELDTELIVQVANDLLGNRPGLGVSAGAYDPTQGKGGVNGNNLPTFSDLFK